MAEAAPASAIILISLDGFRWDYQELTPTPALDSLAASGVQAESLVPVFPSKTFPSHYSIVTGLYPGGHGIVSNNMRDPRWDEEFHLGTPEVSEGRWWGGEPIWTTASRHGRVTASFFWPGSDVLIDGKRPRYFYAYDGAIPYEDRVDQILEWLDLPIGERPSLITLYFADPNDTSHRFGPESSEALAAVRRVDGMIGRLIEGLGKRGISGEIDIVVVSDHGMALMDEERIIVLERYVDLSPDEVFEDGAFLQIYPGTGREATILEALEDAHPRLAVYARDEMPARFRLAGSPRIAPIVGIPDVGWTVLAHGADAETPDGFLRGNHGGDPQHPDMHGIFIASGPSFASGVRVPAFEGIEVYNLLALALGVEPAPNDGDLRRVEDVLGAEELR